MKVLRDIKIKNIKTAVAIGFFDGVHIGHKEVILKAVESGFLPVVLTFDFSNMAPQSKKDFKFIYDDFTKYSILKKLGVKLVVVPFFEKIKNLDCVEFFNRILIEKLNARLIACGENFKFGEGRKGNVKILKELSLKNNVYLKSQPIKKIDGVVVSSTKIRKEIENGNFLVLKKLLGREWYIEFKVEKIFKIGFSVVVFKHIKKIRAFVNEGKYIADLFILGFKKSVLVVVEKFDEDFFLKINILNFAEKDILGCFVKLIFLKKI